MILKSPKLFLSILIVLVYGNTILNSFHFDDIPSILEKPWIRGWDKIPQFIFSVFQRPLVILSFNLNYAISEFEVWSYHVFNICFHIIASLLVFKFVQQIIFYLKDISTKKNQHIFHPNDLFWGAKRPNFIKNKFGEKQLKTTKIKP